MRVAFQIDPLSSLNPSTDSSLLLMTEALRRGYEVLAYKPEDLSITQKGCVMAEASACIQGESGQLFMPNPPSSLALESCHVVWIRQNPPFSMAYLVPTYLLESLPGRVRVINAPAALRNYPEKLWPLLAFKEHIPPTILTRNPQDVLAFLETHREIVLKPLFGYGGGGVAYVNSADTRNLTTLLDFYTAHPEPFLVQQYLPEVTEGDVRVFFIQGDVVGVLGRKPASGGFLSNLRHGSRLFPTTLTASQKACCAVLGAALKERGFFFAGVDLIGDRLLEINVTSPSLIPAFNHLYGACLEAKVWDSVEAL